LSGAPLAEDALLQIERIAGSSHPS
jgi:hypothetical protein